VTGSAVSTESVGKRYKRMRDRRSTLKELIVRGRAKHVDDLWALRDVSLTIPRGSVFGLIGHNGSGKSTLLKVIAGVTRPNQGHVQVTGRVAALIELGAGFHPDLTGRENIRLNGSILGLSRREIDEAMGDIVEFSGLGEFIDEPVKNYSSGMYVRLGFAVAVHMRPDVLLVDEVIAVGDEDFQRKCFDHLNKLRNSGRTIVIVSHSAGMLASMCDQVAWLDHGSLRMVGPAQRVIDAYIASVNAVEGARESEARGEERPGSGEVRLTSVELIDDAGDPVPSAVAGQPLRLRLAFTAREPVTGPVLTVAFTHQTGALVTKATTRASGDLVESSGTGGYVDYLQPSCALNPGNYLVDVSILDPTETHLIDSWVAALELVVRSGGGPVREGLVSLPDRFELPVLHPSRAVEQSRP
jgi:ABC-type polysaccharide/polyol phosphate transport system ATPase subunit